MSERKKYNWRTHQWKVGDLVMTPLLDQLLLRPHNQKSAPRALSPLPSREQSDAMVPVVGAWGVSLGWSPLNQASQKIPHGLRLA